MNPIRLNNACPKYFEHSNLSTETSKIKHDYIANKMKLQYAGGSNCISTLTTTYEYWRRIKYLGCYYGLLLELYFNDKETMNSAINYLQNNSRFINWNGINYSGQDIYGATNRLTINSINYNELKIQLNPAFKAPEKDSRSAMASNMYYGFSGMFLSTDGDFKCSKVLVEIIPLYDNNQYKWQYDRDYIVECLNKLETVTTTKTVLIYPEVKAKLTDEDKKIATDKGWTLA